jgi:hypothetical protein
MPGPRPVAWNDARTRDHVASGRLRTFCAAKPQTVGTDTYWLGSLSVGMRHASGQMYMRNRYH